MPQHLGIPIAFSSLLLRDCQVPPTPTPSHHAVTQPTDHHAASACLGALFVFSTETIDLSNLTNKHESVFG